MRIGFIGAGNMGGAIIQGYAESLETAADKPEAIFVHDSDPGKIAMLARIPQLQAAESLARLVASCDTLVLCVKPNGMDELLSELAALGAGSRLIISIAAGISIAHIQGTLGERTRVVRVMPNTPAMVGEGMSAISVSSGLSEADADAAEKLFSAVGRAVRISEQYMDIVTGISGSSPAYAYQYMEGLIRAGVEGGLPEAAAAVLAAQATLGAAKMVLENLGEVSPRQLCQNVCSPGGTTIEAVKVLEAAGFSETVKKAAEASAAKSKLMTR